MPIPHWDEDPEAWDLLLLGTQALPGVWDIEDGNGKRIIDVKKAPGLDGARVKDKGYEPGALVLVGQLCTAEEWELLQTVIEPMLPSKIGKGHSPVAISHPKAIFAKISQIYITEVEFPRLDNGIMTVTIHATEWTSEPKASQGKTKVVKRKEGTTGIEELRDRQPPTFIAKYPGYVGPVGS
jgi:hypothetical protein